MNYEFEHYFEFEHYSEFERYWSRRCHFPTRYRLPCHPESCGSPVVKISDHDRHVMSSSPVPLKIRRVRR
ncbi:hypothetical protein TNCV_3412931 [Trichonephila clavipes]|uniref:Uncharacterized protein n=1 Tax=Trichonephila clavipes TaxID=2585209 RepID=A0A8X6RP65_TRICX|nr:hypothetical protein TNCV_3412931 [Trichonephila clavipes]